MRLIDADALKYTQAYERGNGQYKRAVNIVYETDIDAAPTIEPIRCGECKYKPTDTGGHNYGQDLEFPIGGKCPCECGDPWYSWMPGDDWFCANGERGEQISAEFAKLMREGEIQVR